jgi:hypothetical protein
MTSDNYKQALEQARTDLAKAIQERDHWNLEIVKLEQLMKSLAQMVSASDKAQAKFNALEAAFGFTETVHTIIRSSKVPLSAMDVRDKLLNLGYDISGYSNPLGFVHSVLGRLEKQGKIKEVGPGTYIERSAIYEALLALGLPPTT